MLGGYVAQIPALHLGSDLPVVHRGDAVLTDGETQRGRMGDDAFFGVLSQHGVSGAGGDAWSRVLEVTWDATTYDTARDAPPGSGERQRLGSALVRGFFTAYTQTAEFVPLDEGLAAITRHAKGLGHDAVVMFLDELVLWLAFSFRKPGVLRPRGAEDHEAGRVGSGERPIPVVSFVARQLDLRRYFVESGGGVGSEQEALDNAFRLVGAAVPLVGAGAVEKHVPRLGPPVEPAERVVQERSGLRVDGLQQALLRDVGQVVVAEHDGREPALLVVAFRRISRRWRRPASTRTGAHSWSPPAATRCAGWRTRSMSVTWARRCSADHRHAGVLRRGARRAAARSPRAAAGHRLHQRTALRQPAGDPTAVGGLLGARAGRAGTHGS